MLPDKHAAGKIDQQLGEVRKKMKSLEIPNQ